MAFTTYTISSLSEVPGAVRAFAASLGFDTEDGSIISFEHPLYSEARAFSVTYQRTGEGTTAERERLILGVAGVGSERSGAIVESPKFNINGGSNLDALVIQQPTLLRLFGNLDTPAGQPGSSWIGGVIEYGFNLYRHFYLGYVQKVSHFEGGEAVTGSAQWPSSPSSTSTSRRGDDASVSLFPFSMKNNYVDGGGGGVYVGHPENPTPWRTFYVPLGSSTASFDDQFASVGESCVLGGFSDSINTGYMAAGKSPFSGNQILTPINLYIGHRIEPNQYFRAIGAPAGVRMVHMEDLEPGASVQIGTQNWMVFPVFSKQSSFSVFRHGGNPGTNYRFPYMNSSQYAGMAYLMNE